MRKIFLLTLVFVLLGTGSLFAQRGTRAADVIEVRIASPLPQQSPWGRTLDRLAAEWSRITNGQVRLRVLHGGTEGGESRMQMSLASNSIQAAVFTSFGLSEINPAVMTMSVPFLIRNERELDAVMNEVEAELEAGMNRGDFFLLAWSRAGFVNFFSREPVFTPDDLRRQRIVSQPDATDINAAFRSMGFQVFETDWLDAGPRLATGASLAAYQNPAVIAAFQFHTVLRNMLSLNIAPVLGGIVMNQVTWRRIGELNPRFQTELMRVTRQMATELDRTMARTVNDAVQSMAREGLNVNRPSPAQEQLWFNEAERAMPSLLGTVYDRDLYNRITEILRRVRGG